MASRMIARFLPKTEVSTKSLAIGLCWLTMCALPAYVSATPTPDPMTWDTVPYATGTSSIAMVATTATDPNGVQYYFAETSGNPGGADSGWQLSPNYEDTGLGDRTQ
ncbi:MAG: hypothetical protein ACYTFK_10975, partial [Planctomycetota bacterium]